MSHFFKQKNQTQHTERNFSRNSSVIIHRKICFQQTKLQDFNYLCPRSIKLHTDVC